MMYEMDYVKSRKITNKLIDIMVSDGLSVSEMTVVAESLPEDLKSKLGDLHISSNKLV